MLYSDGGRHETVEGIRGTILNLHQHALPPQVRARPRGARGVRGLSVVVDVTFAAAKTAIQGNVPQHVDVELVEAREKVAPTGRDRHNAGHQPVLRHPCYPRRLVIMRVLVPGLWPQVLQRQEAHTPVTLPIHSWRYENSWRDFISNL